MMNYYGHDMDHDGKITGKDCGIFHEIMDSEVKSDSNCGKSTWDILGECMLIPLLVFIVPILFINVIGFIGSLFG